jgi:hypothetical protein
LHPDELRAKIDRQSFKDCLTGHAVLVESPVKLESVFAIGVIIDHALGAIKIVSAAGIEMTEVDELFKELVVNKVVLSKFDFDVGG